MTDQNMNSALGRCLRCGIIPILRGHFGKQQVLAIAKALLDEGINVLEITLNSEDALGLISLLRMEHGTELLTGAGTVRTRQAFENAIKAGAQFTIAPNLDALTVAAARDADVLHLPGVLTPTEIHTASALGCKAVKLFPIDTFGSQYLRAVRAPLNDMVYIPTGGVTASNIGEFRKAGAAAVGIGGALVSGTAQTADELRARARQLRTNWDAAETPPKESQ